jgi:hypothetical protein
VSSAIGRVPRSRAGKIHQLDALNPAVTRCGLQAGSTRDVRTSDVGKRLCKRCYRLPGRLRVRTRVSS